MLSTNLKMPGWKIKVQSQKGEERQEVNVFKTII
jgi:hypothetical protein